MVLLCILRERDSLTMLRYWDTEVVRLLPLLLVFPQVKQTHFHIIYKHGFALNDHFVTYYYCSQSVDIRTLNEMI